jgi:chromosome transmission fidelity protein 8
MPSITVHPAEPSQSQTQSIKSLPQILQTPSGLAIVEIQGTLHAPPDAEVGSLVFPPDGKRVYLYVGRFQRLTGEIKKLPKPLAVLRKRDDLEVVEVIHHKILFMSRPEPVGE